MSAEFSFLVDCRHPESLENLLPVARSSSVIAHMTPKNFALAPEASFAMPAHSAFELIFDSFAQNGNEEIRTSVVVSRQLLFRIGSIFVDLEVDKEINSDRVSLTGQMVDSANPGHPPVGIPIVLLQGGKRLVQTSSNDNGEFQLDFVVRRNLKLEVGVNRNRPVRLPIGLLPGWTLQYAS